MTDNGNQGQMLINEQYLTVKKIGQGGFGAVWRAYDFSLRNYVAIKELLKEFNEMMYIEMFYKEALIAKNMIHDNIVRVQHFWIGSNGSYYISMDYVTGRDLEYLIKKCNKLGTKIPWQLAVLICGSVLKAIDYANRLAKDTISGKPYGIVYRDISPGNIIISFEGSVKLSDFGIAKTAEEINEGIKQRVVTGKYAYMSPEQIKGEPDIDTRSDIYSIGLVLYEMLSGKQLYSGDPKEIREQVLQSKFDPDLLSNLKLPYELIEVVVKALEKDKENRYEKAIEMFRDLRRLLKGQETEELTADLASFLEDVLEEEIKAENGLTEKVKQLSVHDAKKDPSVNKVSCKDFIVGEFSAVAEPAARPPAPAEPEPVPEPQPEPVKEPEAAGEKPAEEITDLEAAAKALFEVTPADNEPKTVPPPAEKAREQAPEPAARPRPRIEPEERREPKRPPEPVEPEPVELKGEEKGKTVFEEVGDWLVNKFKSYKRKLVRGVAAAVIAAILFFALDTFFLHLTPLGKNLYSAMYPPDIVITTVPRGARVSMKTREGKVMIDDEDSSRPIELRKIPPRTYLLTATKEGFKPVERVVKIEEVKKGPRGKTQQTIEVNFDFVLSINSEPPGAAVFIDGNKFNVTPCKSQLIAGEHTIKLSLKGFEELGSLAKEMKEGQCNIDFTRPTQSEAMSGVDSRYWSYQMSNTQDGPVFGLTGHLYKKFNVNTNPKNMLVHIDGESKPRGNTPLVVPLKAGDYKMRFMDPDGRFEEAVRTVSVTPEADSSINVNMNKWVTFRVRAKESRDEAFTAQIRIAGSGVNINRDISTAKPLRLALRLGTYTVTFTSGFEFKTLVLPNIDINEKSLIVGELEYDNTILKVLVKDETTDKPVPDAYVWLQSQLAGKTDITGSWEKSLKQGTTTVRIVAKGYKDKSVDKEIKPGRKDELVIAIAPDVPLPAISTAAITIPARPAVMPAPVRPPRPPKPQVTAADVKPYGNDSNVIVCPNCKKEYYITNNKKPRFCTNCGRPFK